MNPNPIGFNPADGILYTRSTDVADLETMLKGLNFIASNKLLPRNLRILEDGRGAHVNFPVTDIPVLVSALEKILVEYTSIRHAVIHNDPTNTAFAIIIDRQIKNDKYILNVFSTFEAARKWVML